MGDVSELSARVATLEQLLQQQQDHVQGNVSALSARATSTDAAQDVAWLLLSAFVVFLMQCGFCMLEAGSVTSKSTESIMMKNLCDCAVTALLWWVVGYAFAFGDGNGFIGYNTDTFFMNKAETSYDWAFFFFQFNFAATASTIVSGATAERSQILSHLFFSSMNAMIIYPVVAHWAWSSSGWASISSGHAFSSGVIDFAGCGPVHTVGGVASLVGAAIAGPRLGRFEHKLPIPLPGHSSVLQVMGTFILWMGWYGFNAGSTFGMSGPINSSTAARVTVITALPRAPAPCTRSQAHPHIRAPATSPAPATATAPAAAAVPAPTPATAPVPAPAPRSRPPSPRALAA